jgi:carboxylesterase
VDDLAATGWDDWSAAAEDALADLAGRVERVVVVGLSMGGSLTAWLATRHPGIAGVVCINPALEIAKPIVDAAREMIASGTDRVPSIGGDVADPEMREKAYDATPLRPLLSFAEALDRLRADLDRVACPVLIMTSTQDHVVDPGDSDILARSVAGPVERVALERSYHVATLDHDRDLIVERSLAFARKVTAGAAPTDR